MDPILERYQALEDKIKEYNPALDAQRLFRAFTYADNAHAGQLRKDGSPYITHPLAVAEIVAELELDTDSIIAALLHDCIEDTGATHEEIAKLFGPTVADLVEGVTKLTRVQYTSKEEEQMENLRKMLMAMAKDIRVILIKICDRLHNMRTMEYQSARKQKEKALETMEIYAPIAHRLGMQRIKWELEDTSLQYLDPIGYREIADELAARSSAHEEFLAGIQKRIQDRLDEEGIRCTIYGRVKHIYSIYRKMYTQNKTMDEIFDLYAFRVIVDDMPECYNVLGVIHDLFNPVLGRFKDYISTPKPNGYQSLHTTVIGREGIPFEVQIRTWEMHHTAEYGIAAHWKYKQGMANAKLGTEEAFEWVRKLLESQQDVDAEEFVRTMRVDLFADEVFVFTPRGDVINLPAGATPIDFAYNIHSAVGNHMTGAKVNGRMVTFDTPLKNGDIVEVITSKSAHGPSRDWMKICKSNEARNKIRQWFKKERREENIATGRASFESELKHVGLSLAAITAEDVLPFILKKVRFGSLDELYAAIGYGGMSAQKAVVRVKDEMTRLDRLHAEQSAAAQEPIHPSTSNPPTVPIRGGKTSQSGIIVEGIDNCLVKFAKCCNPLPGDPIIGFITKGFGVSIHKYDCPNAVAGLRKPEDKDRWIVASWAQKPDRQYYGNFEAVLHIYAKYSPKIIADVTVCLADLKVALNSVTTRENGDSMLLIVGLKCSSIEHLKNIIGSLKKLPDVRDVTRAGR